MSHVRPDRLADLLRWRLSPERADEARRHLDGCAGCRQAMARVRATNEAFDDLLAAPVPDVGGVRGEATVRWSRIRPAVRARPRFVVAAALAAAAAVALTVWNGGAPPREPVGAPSLVRVTPPRRPIERVEAWVTLLGGTVRVTRAGVTAPLSASAHIVAHDRLLSTAQSRVAAEWAEGSGFLLLGDSELSVDELAAHQIELALARGKIDVRRGPHAPTDALQVMTAGHVVSARGTWFTVAAWQSQTTVEVLEGTVEVTDRDGSSSTVLHAPTRAVFGRGRATTTPLGARDAALARAQSEMNLLPPGALETSSLLRVASQPSGTLAVDGVELGPTPLAARGPMGRHYVEIARVGFQPLRRWVTLGDEPDDLKVALPLAPVAPEPSAPVEIEAMVQKRATQIRACYERRLKRDPTLAGTVSLRLRVGDAGQVRSVLVEESTLSDPTVAECLRREAMGWSFAHGRNATVVYPFVFRAE